MIRMLAYLFSLATYFRDSVQRPPAKPLGVKGQRLLTDGQFVSFSVFRKATIAGSSAVVRPALPTSLQLVFPATARDGHRSMRRFKNDLGPALLARIKVFIAFGRPVEWQFVRDDQGRFRSPFCDQFTQLAIVCFYICLASPYVLAPAPKLAKVERNLTLLSQFIVGVRVFRYENPHHPDTASRAHRFY